MTTERTRRRCPWAKTAGSIGYHDREWGVPQHDDIILFEFLVLEGAQAGLSWETILNKRENYRQAMDRFDPEKVARYRGRKIRALLADAGIVRNRMKIEAAVANAGAALKVKQEFGSLDVFLWSFVNQRPRINRWKSHSQVPASTPESEAMSRELRRRGFRFVGPTICYAFMQAVGMVNDHLVGCFRHRDLDVRAGPGDGPHGRRNR
jgi:DNA-3-methyladenine glycosylase I